MSFLRRRDGALTRELVRTPGGFGLGQVPARHKPDAMTSMVCGFCSTGCSLDVHMRDGRAVNITPTTDYPVNLGMACPKGWESLTPLRGRDRATTPLWRDERGRFHAIDWEAAASAFVTRFRAIIEEHGPESVAFLSTGQIPTEEMAFLGAFAKFGMGMVHGDGNTRQCMATSVVAYKESFGFDAPPYTYADLESSDVIVLIGSNLCIAHPILWERICRNPHSPHIVVIDPRVTETASAANSHYALQPTSDLTLLYGIANLLVARGAVDRSFVDAHTTGYDDFVAHVRAFTPDRVTAATGLTVDELQRLVDTIATGERVSFWWTMGVNQGHEATRTAQAIIDLALMTGNIGRPGTGANSVTGQCNAMGSRLFSNTTSLFGGRAFTSSEDRSAVAAALGIDPGTIPDQPSLAYDQIVDGVAAGRIKALWVIATNSAHSWIDQTRLREAFAGLDFLVVQDMYATTETAQMAHLVLPAAGWGEKEGTFINSERRIGIVKRVAPAPGQALADFFIFRLLAEAWGCADLFEEWTDPESVFAILQRLSAGLPCDFSGITGYAHVDRAGGIQWPFPAGGAHQPAVERRLFADGAFFAPGGRARFVYDDPQPRPDPTSVAYPLTLLTGRGSSSQWHTGTRTDTSPVLRALADEGPVVEIAPGDARARGIETGDRVDVESPRGCVRACARVTHALASGQVFVPMHDVGTNLLTHPTFDPHSRQPAFKSTAVEVRRAGKAAR